MASLAVNARAEFDTFPFWRRVAGHGVAGLRGYRLLKGPLGSGISQRLGSGGNMGGLNSFGGFGHSGGGFGNGGFSTGSFGAGGFGGGNFGGGWKATPSLHC
ncbi:hypothetical protein MRX96_009792 [Rhipicephalus microplus]